MNKDQVKGKTKQVVGKIQAEIGSLIGSNKQQIKGLQNESSGKIEKAKGDIEQFDKDAKKP